MTSRSEYRQPPELHSQWVDMANRLGAIVSEPPIAGSQVAVAPEFVLAAQVLMFHCGRAVRTYGAICHLLSHGFTQDAVVLARTLLEVLFEMAFIARFPEDAHYYFEHSLEIEKSFQRNCRAYSPTRIAPAAAPGHPAEPLAGINHGAWHPKFKTVRSRGRESGIPPIYYDLFYSLASRYSHGSGDWLREIARGGGGRIEVSYRGDRMEHDLVLLIACDTFHQLLVVANAALGLKADDILNATHDDITALSSRTWDTLFAVAAPDDDNSEPVETRNFVNESLREKKA